MSTTPVYQGMLEEIRSAIDAGALVPGQKLGTELDWSRRTGLSRVSVRRAIDVLVEEGRVERRAGKGLYIPQASVWTRQVQLVVPGLSQVHHQWVRVAEGVREVCAAHRIGVQIYDAAGSLDEDIRLIEHLPDSGMDGAIIAALAHPRFAEAVYRLKSRGMPFVLVDDTLDQIEVASVMVDHYQGGYQIGEKLVQMGHGRIGFIGRLAGRTTRRQVEGLRDAIADAGLPLDRSLVLDLEVEDPLADWQPAIDRCTRVLVHRKDPPTVIFYANDDVAAWGYRTLKALGVRVPEMMSVVGSGGAPVSRWLEPLLATMDYPSEETGRRAVQLLLQRMKGQPETAQQIALTPIWQPGQSLAPLVSKPARSGRHRAASGRSIGKSK